MQFDIYCDESHPDLLSARKSTSEYMVIGSLWIPRELRETFKQSIHELRNEFKIGGEFKWQKVSPSKRAFYVELIDWFFEQGNNLRFRCIVVEQKQVDLVKFHNNDQELGFYKFYYQMLHHWILDYNQYTIFCDFKSNREPDRLHVLHKCLKASNLSADIRDVQAIRSCESVLMQCADVLIGAVSAKFNRSLKINGTKEQIAKHIESRLGKELAHTSRAEQKLNIFVINLAGGW